MIKSYAINVILIAKNMSVGKMSNLDNWIPKKVFNDKDLLKKLSELKDTLVILKPNKIHVEKKKDYIAYDLSYHFELSAKDKLLRINPEDDPLVPILIFNHVNKIQEIIKEISFTKLGDKIIES